MTTHEDPLRLTPTNKDNLNHVAKRLVEMANMLHRKPFDPKIAIHLRMASDLAEEQVTLGKYYDYPDDITKLKKEPDCSLEEKSKPITKPPIKSSLSDDDIHKWLNGSED